MRLNKYQKAWIARLKSGKTRKCINALNDGEGRHCCLGVAINTCKLERIERISSRSLEDLYDYKKTLESLNLRDGEGHFLVDKISEKWKQVLENQESKEGLDSLIRLNDYTKLSHRQIGEFIDENREAVFLSNT